VLLTQPTLYPPCNPHGNKLPNTNRGSGASTAGSSPLEEAFEAKLSAYLLDTRPAIVPSVLFKELDTEKKGFTQERFAEYMAKKLAPRDADRPAFDAVIARVFTAIDVAASGRVASGAFTAWVKAYKRVQGSKKFGAAKAQAAAQQVAVAATAYSAKGGSKGGAKGGKGGGRGSAAAAPPREDFDDEASAGEEEASGGADGASDPLAHWLSRQRRNERLRRRLALEAVSCRRTRDAFELSARPVLLAGGAEPGSLDRVAAELEEAAAAAARAVAAKDAVMDANAAREQAAEQAALAALEAAAEAAKVGLAAALEVDRSGNPGGGKQVISSYQFSVVGLTLSSTCLARKANTCSAGVTSSLSAHLTLCLRGRTFPPDHVGTRRTASQWTGEQLDAVDDARFALTEAGNARRSAAAAAEANQRLRDESAAVRAFFLSQGWIFPFSPSPTFRASLPSLFFSLNPLVPPPPCFSHVDSLSFLSSLLS